MPSTLLHMAGLLFMLCSSTLVMAPDAPAAQPSNASSTEVDEVLIVIRRQSYEPPFPAVPVGTTVTWVNRDPEEHTVTSDVGLFDGSLGTRERFSFTFTEPGYYFFYCKPHDWMIGEITVEAT